MRIPGQVDSQDKLARILIASRSVCHGEDPVRPCAETVHGFRIRRGEAPSALVNAALESSRSKVIDHRAVIVMRFLLDLPAEDVAVALGIAKDKIAAREDDALDELRGALDDDGETEQTPAAVVGGA